MFFKSFDKKSTESQSHISTSSLSNRTGLNSLSISKVSSFSSSFSSTKSRSANKLHEQVALLNKEFLVENEKMRMIIQLLGKKGEKEGGKGIKKERKGGEWKIEKTAQFKRFAKAV